MAYPYSSLATGRVDSTPNATTQAADHNAYAAALNDLLTMLGTGPQLGSADLTARMKLEVLEYAVSSDGAAATALATGTGLVTTRAPWPFTLVAVRASLSVVSSSGLPTFDIMKNTVTVLSTKLSIDASEKTSVTAATAAVISVTSFSDDDEIRLDCTVAGTGAKGAKIRMYVARTT